MASLDSLKMRAYAAKGIVAQVPSVGVAVGIRLKYLGKGTLTSVIMTTATKLEMITSDGGTDTYTFASTPGCDTMGGLVNAINAAGIFAARLLDVSGAVLTAGSTFKQNTTVTASGDGYYDLTIDGTTASEVSALITPDRFPASNGVLRTAHRVHIQSIDTTQTFAGGTLAIAIIERDILTQAESTLVTYAGSASTVAKAISFASGNGKITSGEGKELLVRTTGGTTLSVALLTVVGIAE